MSVKNVCVLKLSFVSCLLYLLTLLNMVIIWDCNGTNFCFLTLDLDKSLWICKHLYFYFIFYFYFYQRNTKIFGKIKKKRKFFTIKNKLPDNYLWTVVHQLITVFSPSEHIQSLSFNFCDCDQRVKCRDKYSIPQKSPNHKNKAYESRRLSGWSSVTVAHCSHRNYRKPYDIGPTVLWIVHWNFWNWSFQIDNNKGENHLTPEHTEKEEPFWVTDDVSSQREK